MMNANTGASASAGSATNGPASGASAGQPTGGQGAIDYEKAYRELETRMGGMGNELGEYRTFFQNISPLLEKLDQSPELVQAIVDGKVDKQLAQALQEGRITVAGAQVISQASQQVRSEVGTAALEAMTPDKVAKLVEDKAQEIEAKFAEKADLKTFEEKTQKFIESTNDFAEYADEIDKWLDTHDVTDIEVAYYAVKGQTSVAKAREAADLAAAEYAKSIAANAGGGGVTAQFAPDGTPLIDKLVGGPANPIF